MPASVTTVFYVDEVVRVVESRMPALMTAIATEYVNEVKTRMRDSPATGRTYRRGRVVHRASAPGEPPAPDTGRLIQGVVWRIRQAAGKWIAEAGSTVAYALFLEMGAAAGVKGASGRIEAVRWVLFPRPVWRPALLAVRGRIPSIVARFASGSPPGGAR